jgi:parallel beta-helix repeat protein
MTTFSVSNLNDSGLGSLRAAITAANSDSGSPTVISFLVSGTITLTTGDLPVITNKVTIDGTSAPGHASGGAPLVELNCNGNGGLVFATGSDGSKLLGMAIGDASGNGVTLDAGSITLDGNYIGLDLTGTAAIGNGGDGIFVASTSSNNVIGLNPPTALNTAPAGVVSNVISGNAGNGISFHGSSGNTLVANRIGTDASGTAALGNGGNGIWLTGGASGNEIGGTAFIDSTTGDVNDPTGNKGTVTPVFVVPPQGNLVSGNGQNGVLIDSGSQHNTLNGNFIGTDASGNTAIGNALDGVAINSADNNSLVGCQFVNNPFVYYNVVSGNGGNGLHVTDSNDTTVQGNFFGTAANNAAVLGNALDGILVDGTSDTTIVGGVIPLGNVSAGNGQNGIEVKDSASNFITFNTFGGLFAFGGAAPNGNDGLLITSTGANNSVQTNVFSGNVNNGIEIGGNASGVVVEPNIAGLNTVGSAPLPNGNDGLLIDGTAHDIVVGGTIASVIPQNTFSGNLGYGIAMLGQSYDNQVFDARLGTNVEGTAALGNQAGGILIGDTSHGDTIGGSAGNMISGNIGNGVTLAAGTDSIQVTNNTIGFNRGGNLLPNTVAQLVVDPGSTNDTIFGNQIACFAAGTRIATRRGEVAVETLRVGTPVRCLLGNRWEKVIWIGYREIDCRRHPDPRSVHPVRIAAHAFGPGRPARDLLLSPDHAVYVNEVLIPVKYLINRRSIRQIAVKRITYYHVELPCHTVLLAEGLPAESYLDLGDRANFANADVTRLFVAFADVAGAREAKACAPFVVSGPEFEAARKLASRPQRALRHAG